MTAVMTPTATGNPLPWWQVYSGADESRFFRALARSNHEWRTTDGLAKATGLSIKRVEEICKKYVQMGTVKAHSSEPGKWQYYERSAPKKSKSSIADESKKKRVADAS